MCHDNNEIPIIHKFYYLKACLRGEAADVIASLETTNESYSVAWQLFKNRCDNRKFIVERHVRALFDIPYVSKEFSVPKLLDTVQAVDHWDTLLVFIVKDKLNNYTREKWEESRKETSVPLLKGIISFLEQGALIDNT